MVATGLAIRDAVQLERKNIRDGWLKIDRQKTGRPVLQQLDPDLVRDLDGEGEYIFWDEKTLVTSLVTAWQDDLRVLMQEAKLWIPGNVSHRFRDTAVDFWLGQGCSLTEIAAMLGDTVAVCERHYANLASARMKDEVGEDAEAFVGRDQCLNYSQSRKSPRFSGYPLIRSPVDSPRSRASSTSVLPRRRNVVGIACCESRSPLSRSSC